MDFTSFQGIKMKKILLSTTILYLCSISTNVIAGYDNNQSFITDKQIDRFATAITQIQHKLSFLAEAGANCAKQKHRDGGELLHGYGDPSSICLKSALTPARIAGLARSKSFVLLTTLLLLDMLSSVLADGIRSQVARASMASVCTDS